MTEDNKKSLRGDRSDPTRPNCSLDEDPGEFGRRVARDMFKKFVDRSQETDSKSSRH